MPNAEPFDRAQPGTRLASLTGRCLLAPCRGPATGSTFQARPTPQTPRRQQFGYASTPTALSGPPGPTRSARVAQCGKSWFEPAGGPGLTGSAPWNAFPPSIAKSFARTGHGTSWTRPAFGCKLPAAPKQRHVTFTILRGLPMAFYHGRGVAFWKPSSEKDVRALKHAADPLARFPSEPPMPPGVYEADEHVEPRHVVEAVHGDWNELNGLAAHLSQTCERIEELAERTEGLLRRVEHLAAATSSQLEHTGLLPTPVHVAQVRARVAQAMRPRPVPREKQRAAATPGGLGSCAHRAGDAVARRAREGHPVHQHSRQARDRDAAQAAGPGAHARGDPRGALARARADGVRAARDAGEGHAGDSPAQSPARAGAGHDQRDQCGGAVRGGHRAAHGDRSRPRRCFISRRSCGRRSR